MGEPPDVTVVVPVWNNDATIVELTEKLLAELSASGHTHEIVLVDDASADGSWSRIAALTASHPLVAGIRLAVNGGAGTARAAGCSVSRGRWICMIDGDLDYDPRDVLAVIELLADGNDFVSGVRVDARGRPVIRRVGSWVLERMVSSVWSFAPHDLGCGLQGWTAKLAEQGLPHLATHRDMAWAVPLLRPVRRYAEVPVREVASGRNSSHGTVRLAIRLWALLRVARPRLAGAMAVAVTVVAVACPTWAWQRRSSTGRRPVAATAVVLAAVAARCVVSLPRRESGDPPFRIVRRAGWVSELS